MSILKYLDPFEHPTICLVFCIGMVFGLIFAINPKLLLDPEHAFPVPNNKCLNGQEQIFDKKGNAIGCIDVSQLQNDSHRIWNGIL